MEPYNIIGQHGGELLLEVNDSCFEKTGDTEDSDQSTLVFGAMCVGTQVSYSAFSSDSCNLVTGSISQIKNKNFFLIRVHVCLITYIGKIDRKQQCIDKPIKKGRAPRHRFT